MATRQVFFGFDATSPHAIRAAQRYAARRVTEINAETRAAIRATVIRGLRENIPPRELARIIAGRARGTVPLVGMHSRQAMAAMNYRRELETLGFSPATVSRMMGRYTRRKVAERALNIARTETMTALNYGRAAQFNTARRKGLIAKDAGKEWIITPDERLCQLCAPMAGIVVRVDKKFSTPRGELPGPPLHPSCRCTIGLKPIPGGKRLSPIPQPTAAPAVPVKVPTAPKPPPSQPAPTPAPVEPPSSSATELPMPRSNAFAAEGFTATDELRDRARQIEAMVDELLEELGTNVPRTRGLVIRRTIAYNRTIPKQGKAKWGMHSWFKDSRFSVIRLRADGERWWDGHFEGLSTRLGTGANTLASESFRNVIRHEVGHAVYYQTMDLTEIGKWQDVWHAAMKKPPPAGAHKLAKGAMSRVSLYAEYNASEGFAEAWTVYTDPSYKPEMLPEAVRDFFDELTAKPPAPSSVARGGKGWLKGK